MMFKAWLSRIERWPLARRYGVGGLALLMTAVLFRQPLTETMSRHMLVQIPLILAAGMLVAHALRAGGVAARSRWPGGFMARYRRYDEWGVPGLLFVSLVGAYWMIPKALDDALASVPMELFKFAILFLGGIILMDSLKRAPNVIKLFFVGNFSWMTAIVGVLYQDESLRLCNAYLVSDQVWAGRGLIAVSVGLPVFWLLSEISLIKRFLRNHA